MPGGGWAGGKEGAYVTALSNLFKDVADALEANEEFLLDSFGQEAILEVMSGLQQECDVQVLPSPAQARQSLSTAFVVPL